MLGLGFGNLSCTLHSRDWKILSPFYPAKNLNFPLYETAVFCFKIFDFHIRVFTIYQIILGWKTYKCSRVCSVQYRYSLHRYGCRTERTEVTGTGIDVPNLPKCAVPILMLYRYYRSVRYRYINIEGCVRYGTVILGTGVDAVPNLPKCPVPVLMSYQSYRSVRYRFGAVPKLPKCPVPIWCCTEITEVSGTGMKVCTGTGGNGIHIVPNLPKGQVPVLMSYRTYRNVRCRYLCTELTEVSATGIGVVPNLLKCPVPVFMSYRTYRSVRYRY